MEFEELFGMVESLKAAIWLVDDEVEHILIGCPGGSEGWKYTIKAQWTSGNVSPFPTTGSRFYPRAGQGQLNLSSLLQWVDKLVSSLLGDLNTGGLASD
ncbi:hypothetical protein TNCV_2297271 [Trichonephila clavipes]|nr:hypothetical protein TNCV_2297271 [Trichonephila clavipes]